MHYGSRTAIDQSLSKLVKGEIIDRLANGVFVSSRFRKQDYSAEEIAKVKAESFARQLFDHGSKLAHDNAISKTSPDKTIFALNRSSSAFNSVQGRIKMRIASGRKQRLSNNKIGDIVRGLWHLGEDNCSMKAIQKVTTKLNRAEAMQILNYAAFMPYWLLSLIRDALGNLWLLVAVNKLESMSREMRQSVQKTLEGFADAAQPRKRAKRKSDLTD